MASAAYTLHVAPFAVPGDPGALDRAEIVRDGFSWGAFLVPGLWLLLHRCWVAGIAAFVVVIGLGALLGFLGAGPGSILVAQLLLHLLFGLEGASLRRLSLARAGRPATAIVIAADTAEAEAKSFARWLEPEPAYAPAPVPAASAARRPASLPYGRQPVIGLFPEPGGRA
jgi:hypothetical protein